MNAPTSLHSSLGLLGMLGLLARAPAQDDPPIPPSPEEQAAMARSDFIMGVAGNEAVLRSDLEWEIMTDEALNRRRAGISLDDPQELQRLLIDALEARLTDLIKVQAGRDLGFDPEAVDFITEQYFEETVERIGGPQEASRFLQGIQSDPERRRREIQDQLLMRSWERSVRGAEPGATGRAAVDNYVRPGWLFSAHSAFSQSPEPFQQELVGMLPERFTLQQLVLDCQDYGGRENTQALALELRGRHQDEGWDFDGLVRNYGSGETRRNDGYQQALSLEQVAKVGQRLHGGPELGRWVGAAQPGDVSEPLLATLPDGSATWCLYRLTARTAPTAARPFLDLEVQQHLRTYLAEERDRIRLEQAFQTALEASFVYPEALESFLRSRKKIEE